MCNKGFVKKIGAISKGMKEEENGDIHSFLSMYPVFRISMASCCVNCEPKEFPGRMKIVLG